MLFSSQRDQFASKAPKITDKIPIIALQRLKILLWVNLARLLLVVGGESVVFNDECFYSMLKPHMDMEHL